MKVDQSVLVGAQRVAMTQAGVLTRTQADACEVSRDVRRRLVDEGVWRRIAQGLYALSPDSWQQRSWAGVLIGGPSAVLGHEAALRWWGFGPDPEQITVFVDLTTGFPDDDRWRFIRSPRHGYGTPERTSLSEAVIDVGGHWLADDLLTLVGAVVTGRKVTPDGLRAELAARGRHRQRRLVSSIIDDVANGTATVLESRYRNQVEKAHGLPIPCRQTVPVDRYRVDNWYEKYHLIIEVDGKATHLGLAAAVDMERDNFHMSHGIATLRFNWQHVTRTPCQTARIVARALTQAGWLDRPHPCPRCAPSMRTFSA